MIKIIINHPFGNGNHTTYQHGDLGVGLWNCFNHILPSFFPLVYININGFSHIIPLFHYLTTWCHIISDILITFPFYRWVPRTSTPWRRTAASETLPAKAKTKPLLDPKTGWLGTRGWYKCLVLRDFWLVVWNMVFWFSIQLDISSSQLTNSIIFQRGRYTTSQICFTSLHITWSDVSDVSVGVCFAEAVGVMWDIKTYLPSGKIHHAIHG